MKNLKQIEVEFDLLWGIAPKDSLKYAKGKVIKNFIRQAVSDALEACTPEKHCEEEIGWNDCREKMIENKKELMK